MISIRLPPYEYKYDLRFDCEYVGWILRDSPYLRRPWEEVVKDQLRSDHGEERFVDEYKWGAVCWLKEAACPSFGPLSL